MSQPLNSKFTGRVSQLDALRGIAALAVVLFHFTFGFDNGYRILSEDRFYFRYGYLGVQLFFMISGFVILMTIDKTKQPFDFIVSRFSRLYPVYWVCIIITVLATFIMQVPKQQGMYSVSQVLVNFTMLQSFFKVKDVDGAYWTLAIELVFYFWMWVMFISKNRNNIILFGFFWVTLSCFSFFKIIP
jgi:peptidoglycan/LPS O-acetylase OafA/YrhL